MAATGPTPTHSILFVGAVAFEMAMAGVLGAGQQEAFKLLQNVAGISYARVYLAMFALPLIGRQKAGLACRRGPQSPRPA